MQGSGKKSVGMTTLRNFEIDTQKDTRCANILQSQGNKELEMGKPEQRS